MKQNEETDRRNKVKNKNRDKQFLIFVDLKKAFDNVQRTLLIKKLLKYGVNNDLCAVVQERLKQTIGQIEDQEVNLELGVP